MNLIKGGDNMPNSVLELLFRNLRTEINKVVKENEGLRSIIHTRDDLLKTRENRIVELENKLIELKSGGK